MAGRFGLPGFWALAGLIGLVGVDAPAAERAPVVTIEVLLDNSPSMEIGATPGDIAAMMHLTPCSVPGAAFPPGRGTSASQQDYEAYECSEPGDRRAPRTRFNGLACPIPAARGVVGQVVMQPAEVSGPRCDARASQAVGATDRGFATAGAPCAFACHWDVGHAPDATRDYYGVARSTLGQPPCYQTNASPDRCGITLRADLVKNAVARLVNTMQEDNFRGLADFSVGVFTFGTKLNAVYPVAKDCSAARGGCAAGQDWALALGRIGTAPALPNTRDTGIQPMPALNGPGSTDFAATLDSLAKGYLSGAASGAGAKALFLVTDGMDDHSGPNGRHFGAIDPGICQVYKSMGYEVYVLYTPYYPLMNPFYLYNMSGAVEGDGPESLAYNLRQCASDPKRDFIQASAADAGSVSRALQVFLGRTIARR